MITTYKQATPAQERLLAALQRAAGERPIEGRITAAEASKRIDRLVARGYKPQWQRPPSNRLRLPKKPSMSPRGRDALEVQRALKASYVARRTAS